MQDIRFIKISHGEFEIRIGKHIAYGEVALTGETYALDHAPTQGDFDAVAAALDSMSPAQIRASLADHA